MKDIMNSTLDWAKAKGAKKFGYVGICYGAWAGFKASESGEFACGVNPHPSIVLEKFAWGGDDEAMGKTAKCNMLILPTKQDPENLKPGGTVLASLHANGFTDSQSVEFRDMDHGF